MSSFHFAAIFNAKQKYKQKMQINQQKTTINLENFIFVCNKSGINSQTSNKSYRIYTSPHENISFQIDSAKNRPSYKKIQSEKIKISINFAVIEISILFVAVLFGLQKIR